MATILTSPKLEQVVHAGADLFLAEFSRSGRNSGVTIGLCGGRSVVPFLHRVLEERFSIARDLWRKARFFLVDERLVPDDHPESNFKLLREVFYGPLLRDDLISPEQCFSLKLAGDDAKRKVAAYEEELRLHGGRFDIALLGVGEDAHVGALFPGHPLLNERRAGYSTLFDSPKPPPARMTATPGLLRSCPALFAFLFGEGKRGALSNWQSAEATFFSCPAKIVNEVANGYVLTDIVGEQ
jgi:6-phosphogluconolactonase